MLEFVAIRHPRFRKVERAIFLRRVTADCMSHQCAMRTQGSRLQLDACCQYGADVDVGERDAILSHREQIATLLEEGAAASAWFTSEESLDKDFPSGRHVRSTTYSGGCVFLAHDGRGCAIHRASIEGGWDFDRVKPNVCRLFPLSYDDESILFSDDYEDYSCSADEFAPTVYRASRDTLEAVFGAELVRVLDEAEAMVAPAETPLLRVVSM